MRKDDDYLEVPEYSPKSDFSKAQIISQAIMKVIEARGKEMKPGYFNTFLTKEGDAIKTWIPDSRKEFIGTCEALLSLLSPEIKREAKMKDLIKKFEKDKQNLFDLYSCRKLNFNDNGELIPKGEKFIPALDEEFILQERYRTGYQVKVRPILVKGMYNDQVNLYWEKLVKLYDELFSNLNILIDQLNYFKPTSGY